MVREVGTENDKVESWCGHGLNSSAEPLVHERD